MYTYLIPNAPLQCLSPFPLLLHIVKSSLSSARHPTAPNSRELESEACHTALVLINGGGAFLLGIFRVGEEHALIAEGFLFLAHAAGLSSSQHLA
jgi:hypothetical protein